MKKAFSILTLAGMIALPAAATAGGVKAPADISNGKVEELAQQVDQLQEELARKNEIVTENDEKLQAMNENLEDMESKLEDMNELLEERSEAWDLASRFLFDRRFFSFSSRLVQRNRR